MYSTLNSIKNSLGYICNYIKYYFTSILHCKYLNLYQPSHFKNAKNQFFFSVVDFTIKYTYYFTLEKYTLK